MNGCCSTVGVTWQRCKTLQRSGFGHTTMTAQIWPLLDPVLSSDWPLLRNVSTSVTVVKGNDYHMIHNKINFVEGARENEKK
jgi:hypothetical protein